MRLIEYIATLKIMRKVLGLSIIGTLAVLLLAACSGSSPTPTATLSAVPNATLTPVPSATPSPTPDAIPNPVPNATPAASVTVSPQSATVAIGQSRQLTATLKDVTGNILTGLTITWSSSNPSAVAVSATGLVTGIAPGSATITVKSGAVIGTVRITVGEITAASVSLSPQSATLARGQTQQLAATISDANGNVLTGLTVTWSSSNPSAATVAAAGLVTGIASGSATITATAERKTGTALVTVTDATVTSVTVSPQSATVAIGQSRQFVATISDANGNVLTGLTVIWSSSNQSTATVSAAGLVTGTAPGSATITATSEGKTGTALITVSDVPVVSVIVSPPSPSLVTGRTQQLLATLKDSNGNVLTGLIITWSSSNPSAATVSVTGLVTGIAPGSATITAKVDGKTGASLITVSDAPVASVTVGGGIVVVLIVGQTRQLVATLKDANGNTLSGRTVTWFSSDPSVATVTTTGLVAGIKQGSATVTATVEGISGTTTIEIVLL